MAAEPLEAAELLFSLIQKIHRYKAEHMLTRYRVNNVSEWRLSQRQYQILYLIHYANVRTLTQMSGIMHLSASGLSLIISKMVKNGYIRKNYDVLEGDRRKVHFQATRAGTDELAVITDMILEGLCAFLDGMDEETTAEFCESIALLRMSVQTGEYDNL